MALLKKETMRTLISIGAQGEKGDFICHATGFLVGFSTSETDGDGNKLYQTFLVTNRHVFEGKTAVVLRFDGTTGIKTFPVDLNYESGETRWLAHDDKDVDLVILKINPDVLKQNEVEPAFIEEEGFAFASNFESLGISAGDDVYVIGFPLGIAGIEQNYPCAKSGIISRVDSEIITQKKAFIIDSSIFPGNSGGPVILKPTSLSLEGTIAVEKSYLIGIISGYLPYEDKLYTHQTNPPSVVSLTRENSGLSFVVPIEYAKEIHNKWISDQKPSEPSEPNAIEAGQEEIKASIPK